MSPRWTVERRPSDRAISAAFWTALTACSVMGAVVAGAVLEAFTRRWPTGGAR
jgi:hypothetical protein